MKKIVLFILAFTCAWCLKAQIAYYDAVALTSFVNPSNHKFISDTTAMKEVCDILKKYCTMLPEETTVNNVIKAITTNNPANKDFNPILASYFGIIPEASGGLVSGKSKSFASSIGNLDVTNFADGLAKFLVARAKEELNVAFFRKFQEYIQRYPEVQVIFPATYDLISRIFSYQYATFLPALRSCFHQDMNAFSTNLINLRELTRDNCPDTTDETCTSRMETIHNFLNENTLGRTFVAGLLVSDNLIKGSNAIEILDIIANDEVCFGRKDNFSNSIRLINLISNSLRSTQGGELWVTKNQINKLIGNVDAIKLYMGLLYSTDQMQSMPITFTKANAEPLTFKKLLVAASDTGVIQFTRFRNNLRALGYLSAGLSLQTKTLQQEEGDINEDALLKFYDYATTIADFLEHGVTFFNTEDTTLAKDVHLFTEVLENAAASCYDIKSRNYTALVLHTSSILDAIKVNHSKFKNDYIKYGTFMANVIEANNSDEVKAAIEAAVLPVGSSSVKRETFSNISLNAFIGPMAGMEYLPGLTEDQWAPVMGVTAPLGVAFNWGNFGNGRRNDSLSIDEQKTKARKGGKSLSLFFPLIDVGALATFRIGDDSSYVASEVKLENIMAPGIYGYWGFGKIPVSVGFGAQIGPQLRKINSEDANVDKNFYVRFGLNVVVDIPFFNFYTRN